MRVNLIAVTENAEKLIEYSSRVCYDTVDKITQDSCEKFIKGLIRRKHFSCLEFAYATFSVSGISRACQNQLVRSRLHSHLVQSQRYVDSEDFDYVVPCEIQKNKKASKVFLNAMKFLSVSYSELRLMGIKKEDARSVLPNACETTMVTSANFRQWRHFIELRCDKAAQKEIRELSNIILDTLYENSPSVFADLFVKLYDREVTQ